MLTGGISGISNLTWRIGLKIELSRPSSFSVSLGDHSPEFLGLHRGALQIHPFTLVAGGLSFVMGEAYISDSWFINNAMSNCCPVDAYAAAILIISLEDIWRGYA
jgi:hypothetical protein